jgi:hypothetical protein
VCLVTEIGRGESWSGRACCPLPQSEKCQHACVTATTKQDLVQSCRKSDELAFFTCLDRQEVSQTLLRTYSCVSRHNWFRIPYFQVFRNSTVYTSFLKMPILWTGQMHMPWRELVSSVGLFTNLTNLPTLSERQHTELPCSSGKWPVARRNWVLDTRILLSNDTKRFTEVWLRTPFL